MAVPAVFAELAARRAAYVVCVDRSLTMLQLGRIHRDEIASVLTEAGFYRSFGNVQRMAGDIRALPPLSGLLGVVRPSPSSSTSKTASA